ncbi:MAG TPA: hypothetical protein VE994_15580, partial [Terriglobales bacterium]|nr:hypothetical protein [Terriglobales bacterium]
LAAKPRETIPFVARNALPRFVGALLLGAVFAKVISTANNYLFSPATNLVNDVYLRFVNKDAPQKKILLVSRVLVILLGLFALLQGAYWESILAMMLYAYTIYSAAITPVVMSAFFWKRATAAGAVVSILMGTAVTVFWNLCQVLATSVASGQVQDGGFVGAVLSVWSEIPPGWRERDAIFPALIISVASLVVVSLVTAAPRPEQWAPFFAEEKVQATTTT